MSKVNHLVKRITPPEPEPTQFGEIESGTFFKDWDHDLRDFYQKVKDPDAVSQCRAVRVRDGALCWFAHDAKVEPFGDDDEVHIKMWRSE
jgi:cysteine synthase